MECAYSVWADEGGGGWFVGMGAGMLVCDFELVMVIVMVLVMVLVMVMAQVFTVPWERACCPTSRTAAAIPSSLAQRAQANLPPLPLASTALPTAAQVCSSPWHLVPPASTAWLAGPWIAPRDATET